MAPEPYLTVNDITLLLNLSKPDSILAAIHRGELQAVNVSRGEGRPTWRISREALNNFIMARSSIKPAMPTKRKRLRTTDNVTQYF